MSFTARALSFGRLSSTVTSSMQLSQIKILHNFAMTSIYRCPLTPCSLTSSSYLYIDRRCSSENSERMFKSPQALVFSTRNSRFFLSSQKTEKLTKRQRSAIRCSGATEEIATEKPVELPIFSLALVLFPASSCGKTIKSGAHWALLKESTLQHIARILVGSSLLFVSLGLGMARPALARIAAPPTAETLTQSSKEIMESNLEVANTDASLEGSEVGNTPPQPIKEEEKDPAELVLLSYLERHPKDMKALEGLMYVRLRKGNVAKALEVVEKLLRLRPEHAPWQFIRAQSLEFVGSLEEARHAFESILEKDPLSARALQGLATVMSKTGEGEEMLDMLQRAVQTAVETGKTKESKNLRMLLGQMYTLQGNLQEALRLYQDLEKEDPRDFRPYLCQGLVYSLLNQKVDAERAFRRYRRLSPKTFPERGYLDDLMVGAKIEARKLQERDRLKSAKGKKASKPMRQPNIDTAVAEDVEEEN